jgi:transcriptional regulator with XRE-family HTH domain
LVLTLGPGHNHNGVVTLSEFLTEASIDHRQFAKRIGVSSEAVRRYVNGDRIPDKRRMAKIVLATGGKVTANDFFGLAA